jgi:adhesin transport system outer membrane protein
LTYRHAQAKNARDSASRSVENDVRQTWESKRAAAARAEQFRVQAAANSSVVQAYKDQFNLDRRTLLDVLDAQNEWFVSRSNSINNEYLEMFAGHRLLALKGKLMPYLGVSYPKEAIIRDRSSGNMNGNKSGRTATDNDKSIIPNWIGNNKS